MNPAHDTAPLLLVDDRVENLLSLEGVLEHLGQPMVRATSGAEALRKVLTTEFAVILLDVNMPEMDGYDTARIIKSRPRCRHVPIIFLTASERASATDMYRLGAVDFLQKPFSPEVLTAKVSVFIELHLRGERLRAQEIELLHQAQKQSDLEKHRFAELLLAVVSHDLRTPLSSLMASLQLLERRSSDETSQQVLARATGSAARMGRMIDQLLDLTRVRLGSGMALKRTDAELSTVVRAVVEEIHATLPDRRIVVEGDEQVDGQWDVDRLSQVFQNLVGNAVRHGAATSPIRVRVTATADRAHVLVHNQGPPIPVELRTSLFDPFRRGEVAPRGGEGLGLGLYIAQQIAMAHDGRIIVESDERGTEFRLDLPRTAPAAPSR